MLFLIGLNVKIKTVVLSESFRGYSHAGVYGTAYPG